mmetsp:Transcript_28033/g.66940  ORF Transcript_28033/g.66940 Transcript_28033/m.66940 type:complete len:217 (+) Transcript_28033:1354-2004(+)
MHQQEQKLLVVEGRNVVVLHASHLVGHLEQPREFLAREYAREEVLHELVELRHVDRRVRFLDVREREIFPPDDCISLAAPRVVVEHHFHRSRPVLWQGGVRGPDHVSLVEHRHLQKVEPFKLHVVFLHVLLELVEAFGLLRLAVHLLSHRHDPPDDGRARRHLVPPLHSVPIQRGTRCPEPTRGLHGFRDLASHGGPLSRRSSSASVGTPHLTGRG